MNHFQNIFSFVLHIVVVATCVLQTQPIEAAPDYQRALKRASYLLNGVFPEQETIDSYGDSQANYRAGVRTFIQSEHFYDSVLRYHERMLGVGLPSQYLEDLKRSDLDGRENKFARLTCVRDAANAGGRFRCFWQGERTGASKGCERSQEVAAGPFWRPGLVAWVCPSVTRTCGSDLSKCFIAYQEDSTGANAELGASEVFDSEHSVLKSLSRQAAGLATAVAIENFPYTKILEPGLTAVDSAIVHFFKQGHHFDLERVHLPENIQQKIGLLKMTDTRFKLLYSGSSYELGGVLSTFGFLRRYEKNRTRANQTYERLLCRKFSSELPAVFPQDPGNLRETPGCSGCHATLDPLADFFAAWGEGGNLYDSKGAAVQGVFAGKSGYGLAALVDIIREDDAFATCTVQNVWDWLVGRKMYKSEEPLRTALTDYFKKTNFSFRELVYAISTHPLFTESARADATVTDPLQQPALGKVPEQANLPCPSTTSYAVDIAPKITMCTSCHASGSSRQPLQTEAQWQSWAVQALGLMASGNMPPGQTGAPAAGPVYQLKEAVRCWIDGGKQP